MEFFSVLLLRFDSVREKDRSIFGRNGTGTDGIFRGHEPREITG